MSRLPADDTIVAPATPEGESALAMIRASGPLARVIAEQASGGSAPLPRHVWHGDFVGTDQIAIDDVVYCFFEGPKSYTGEDILEISCHGNPLIVSKIVDDLCRRGCRVAEPGEFTRRAYVHGRIDLTKAEAVIDVIKASSERALDLAQRQLRGELTQRMEELTDRVLHVCATVEAQIDFPEEDLPGCDREALRHELAAVREEIGALAATRRRAELLRDGVRVVLIGPPNAGKSSVFNRLVGVERAIVNEEPGTTRDFLEESISLGRYRIRLCDTAGVREVAHPVERAGVRRSLERALAADLVVVVVAPDSPALELPDEVLVRIERGSALWVANKCDLDPAFAWRDAVGGEAIRISARTGAGFSGLTERILTELTTMDHSLGRNESLAVNARHAVAMERSIEALGNAEALLTRDGAFELIACELNAGIGALREVVGGRIDDEVLDRLFARFCIGK